jgi:DNA modification methylase
MIIVGDCLDVLKTMDDDSIDAIVTDPPYGLAFMGKRWDYDVPSVEIWQECLRVLKPGGHLLAFAGTRTQHRMCVRIEDAGFEIRDMIAWVYGSGFPKSLDVSKAIDKAAGAEREVVGTKLGLPGYSLAPDKGRTVGAGHDGKLGNPYKECAVTAPATDAARQWEGWGTALKPALEPITVARKPLVGTVANNVMRYGTGAINVDGCRVESDGSHKKPFQPTKNERGVYGKQVGFMPSNKQGRWPANLIHDGSDEVTGLFPHTTSGSRAAGVRNGMGFHGANGDGGPAINGSSGSAARFFYCAKASKRDRDEGLNLPARQYSHDGQTKPIENAYQRNNSTARNNHPTVKPTELMRYLCRLVTPPGGVVLDPFCGSGSTGKAAVLEGFRFVGIERDESYAEIARARIGHVNSQINSIKIEDENQLDLF